MHRPSHSAVKVCGRVSGQLQALLGADLPLEGIAVYTQTPPALTPWQVSWGCQEKDEVPGEARRGMRSLETQ